jgi:hypothetical protein
MPRKGNYLLDTQIGSAHNGSDTGRVFDWSSRKLWNVAEMIEHLCSLFCSTVLNLFGTLFRLRQRMGEVGESSPISEADKFLVTTVIAHAKEECNRFGLEEGGSRIAVLETRLEKECSLITVHVELQNLQIAMLAGLSRRSFAFIRPELALYFENDTLLGDVADKFNAARQDAKDAGNALAAELYTASVFHQMRVAEHGLRRLAQKLNIKLLHKGGAQPIEFADWDKVITGIKNKIDAIRKLPIGNKRLAQLEVYSDAADHCTFMKDIWRNNVSHTRKPYIEAEAIAVLSRVRDFMTLLGNKL